MHDGLDETEMAERFVSSAGGVSTGCCEARTLMGESPARCEEALVGVHRRRARVFLQLSQVGIDHQPDQAAEAGLCFPAEMLAGLGGISNQQLDFARPIETWVDVDIVPPVQIHV